MKKVKLGDTKIQLIDGDRGSNYPSKKDFYKNGYCVFLDASNVTKTGFNLENPIFISKSKSDSMRNGKLIRDDIVITTRGTIGNICHYDEGIIYENIRINSGMLIIRNSDVFNTKYLYYLLRSEIVGNQIKTKTTGSSQPQITVGILNDVTLLLPDLPTQTAIANVLSALDEKIALNNKINKELEAMAKALYGYWFVQFDFPDENGKPYKSSGGKMVWNDNLKKKLPYKWESCQLKYFLENVNCTIISGRHLAGQFYTPIDQLPKRQMCFFGGLNSDEAKSSLQAYKSGDILLGAMRVYFHRVCIAPQNGITRSTTMVLRPKNDEFLPFIYQLINDDLTIQYAIKISIGTQQPYVNWESSLSDYTVILPEEAVITKYSKIIHPFINKIFYLVKENYALSQLRDYLLPLLMNGQVKISDPLIQRPLV